MCSTWVWCAYLCLSGAPIASGSFSERFMIWKVRRTIFFSNLDSALQGGSNTKSHRSLVVKEAWAASSHFSEEVKISLGRSQESDFSPLWKWSSKAHKERMPGDGGHLGDPCPCSEAKPWGVPVTLSPGIMSPNDLLFSKKFFQTVLLINYRAFSWTSGQLKPIFDILWHPFLPICLPINSSRNVFNPFIENFTF